MLDIATQLFIYQAIKPAIRDFRWYKPAMWTLIGLCSVCILLHLLPPHIYVYTNLPINRVMTGMSLVNLTWIGYFSLVAYRRAGILYLGLFFLMLIGDVVVKQLSELIRGNEQQGIYRILQELLTNTVPGPNYPPLRPDTHGYERFSEHSPR